jgi:hypothetical protein
MSKTGDFKQVNAILVVGSSVSLASHDGSSDFGVLCGDLASGIGTNLDLSYFLFSRSSTQLALLNGVHVEILGRRTR